ncbi:MAG TPA: hypothetical protein VGH23_22395 [Rhizomicrobium sp.]|jgi:hypothetical protein
MAIDDQLDIEHLTWLVESRAKNQKASLKLLSLFRSYSTEIKSSRPALIAQKLVAVAFSLWRAAFLADKKNQDGLEHADIFLEKMIVDNAINYPQDRTARAWSFSYYISNARHHLKQLAETWPSVKPIGPTSRNPRARWSYLQQVFEIAVNQFESDLKAIRARNEAKSAAKERAKADTKAEVSDDVVAENASEGAVADISDSLDADIISKPQNSQS